MVLGTKTVLLVSKQVKSFCSHSVYDPPSQQAVPSSAPLIQSMQKKLCCNSTSWHDKHRFVQILLEGLTASTSCCTFSEVRPGSHPTAFSSAVCLPWLSIIPSSTVPCVGNSLLTILSPSLLPEHNTPQCKVVQPHPSSSLLKDQKLPVPLSYSSPAPATSYQHVPLQRMSKFLLFLCIFQTRSASACFWLNILHSFKNAFCFFK